ncbi:MAG: Zn-ribbon domain-containing OB-fold protein [Candidatus Thermoplasmatota archaeon]
MIEVAVIGRRARREEQVFVSGKIPMEYMYTAGAALDPFFKGLKDRGELYGTQCQSCGTRYFPPVHFCEICFERIEKKVEVPGHGALASFTIAHHDHLGRPLEKPEIWGLIWLDGTDTPFIHRVIGDPMEIEIGAAVMATLKPKEKRAGALDDIEGFEVI